MSRTDGSLGGGPEIYAGAPWIWPVGAAEPHSLAGAGEEVVSSGFSPDAEALIYERKDGTVLLAAAGAPVVTVGKGAGQRGQWELSEGGRVAMWSSERAASSLDHVLFDTALRTRRTITVPAKSDRNVLSKRGDIAVFTSSEQILVYDVAKGTPARRFAGHGAPVYWATLSRDGQTLATGGYDKTVRTLDLATGETRAFAGLEGVVSTVAFWPDGKKIIAASSAGDVRLFEPGRAGAILTDHRAPSFGLAVSADGRVASLDVAGHLRITDLEGKPKAEHALGPLPMISLQISPDRRRFAGAPWVDVPPGAPLPDRGTLVLGAFDGAKPALVALPTSARDIEFAVSGEAAFVALVDGTVQKVDPSGALTEVDRLGERVNRLAVSPDGVWLAAGGAKGSVRLTKLATGEHRDLGRHKEPVLSLGFSPPNPGAPGALLASGSLDHTIRLWNIADGSFRSVDASGSGVRRVAFSPDGRTLFALNDLDALVHRWSVETFDALPPFTGHTGSAHGVVFSEDGGRVLTFGDDDTARVFDLATGSSRALPGHEKQLTAAVFGPGGRVIVTLGSEGVVRAWPDDLPYTLPELRAWIDAATPDRLEHR
jgi:WD40 repeat protein